MVEKGEGTRANDLEAAAVAGPDGVESGYAQSSRWRVVLGVFEGAQIS